MFNLLGFIPYAHVADVNESIAFYEHLGLVLDSRFGPEGRPYWARMRQGNCDLMLALASGEIDPRNQAVLFYLHVDNLKAVREKLLAAGVQDRGQYAGESEGEFPRSGCVFDIVSRDYMPSGEMRVHDPDGYVLLIGELG
ncbi:MAG TPA: hypothetical protein PKA27_03565 [Fimbriimonadaceae bacterium]|nr:hypothetical protein [Fimbriimonadaceae bacterium]